MPTLELKPVSHITTDAIGQPGQRIFYLQARKGDHVITLIVEKIQLQSLSVGMVQFLEEVQHTYPLLSQPDPGYLEDEMHITPPLDPLFRAGEIRLAYDDTEDLVILTIHELPPAGEFDADLDLEDEAEEDVQEDESEEVDSMVVRLWATRSQLSALCHWSIDVIHRGRPICPQCGEPMEPEGHFCPKKNGRKH